MASLQQPHYKCRFGRGTLVLFIHGIVEGPDQFLPWMDLALSQGMDAASLLLPGHGGTGREFAHSSGQEWLEHVRTEVARYKERYDSLILVGHSMGGLLSLLVAHESPDKIRGVVCMETPLAVWVKARAVRNCLKVGFYHRVPPSDSAYALMRACSVAPFSFPLAYLTWIPRIVDLFVLIHRTRAMLPSLAVPVLAFHADEDELVGAASAHRFMQGVKPEWLRIIHLPHSTHFVYGLGEEEVVRKELADFLMENGG